MSLEGNRQHEVPRTEEETEEIKVESAVGDSHKNSVESSLPDNQTVVETMSTVPSLVGGSPARRVRRRIHVARVTPHSVNFLGSQVSLLFAEHTRKKDKGLEKAILLGPVKFSTPASCDIFAQCASQQLTAPFPWRVFFDNVERLAYPYSVPLPGDVAQTYGAMEMTVRSPNQAELRGMEKRKSLWVIDVKDGSTVVKTFFSFFGQTFEDMDGFQAFLEAWGQSCPQASLMEIERVLLSVRIPTQYFAEMTVDAVNQTLGGIVFQPVPEPSALSRVIRRATGFFRQGS